MVLLKLGMVRKKVLLFVNSIDAGFRLKLFLEAFGIRSAVINAELPLNSRHHILQVRHGPVREYRRMLTGRLFGAISAFTLWIGCFSKVQTCPGGRANRQKA